MDEKKALEPKDLKELLLAAVVDAFADPAVKPEVRLQVVLAAINGISELRKVGIY